MKLSKFPRLCKAIFMLSAAEVYVATFGRKYLKKNIWIVGEKKTEARDNGYHFFKYLRAEHPEINSYYVIKKGSSDSEKVQKIGPTIDFDSFKHCIYYAAAKVRACSQIHGVQPFEDVAGIRHLRIFIRKDQRHINLKHGITKDFRPSAFDFRKAGFDLYVSGAKPEYEEIKKQYNYPDKNIVLSGFCRFDALHGLPDPEKIILVMPTFRDWLRTSDSSKKAADDTEMARFKESEYYKTYKTMLTDDNLLNTARSKGYRILFYLHYTFQPYTPAFAEFGNDVVTVCGRNDYDVQKLLVSSAMLVTDYSSVFFDYGYMMKPMVFCQFDLNEYREKHYKEGYFSYERDAFGPITYNIDDALAYVIKMLNNDLIMEEEYKKRAERFFIPHDNKNCERVYNAILRLDSEE